MTDFAECYRGGVLIQECDAFGHLKAIGVDAGGRALLDAARVPSDSGVIDVADQKRFISAAKTRAWDREASVRSLA